MKEDPLFACRRCGNCCRRRGIVRVEPEEIIAISGFLGMSDGDFLESHTRLAPDRSCLALLDASDGACEFLIPGPPAACRIDPVKPRQCRDFPVKWNDPGWETECPGAEGLV